MYGYCSHRIRIDTRPAAAARGLCLLLRRVGQSQRASRVSPRLAVGKLAVPQRSDRGPHGPDSGSR